MFILHLGLYFLMFLCHVNENKNYIAIKSSVLAIELCTAEWHSWNSNPITRMKMTTKGMTTLFLGSFQLCELCSYTVSFKRFVIDPFSLALHSPIFTFLFMEVHFLLSLSVCKFFQYPFYVIACVSAYYCLSSFLCHLHGNFMENWSHSLFSP